MKTAILFLSVFITVSLFGQEDWKLPIRKGKIQFEFNSEKLNSGRTDLCEFYMSHKAQMELLTQLNSIMATGKTKLLSSSKFNFAPNLYAADASSGTTNSALVKCKSGNDTLIGSVMIIITQAKVGILGYKIRSASIKCLYRIILKDDSYNIKMRGFKYNTGVKTVPLEDVYDEFNVTKSDKKLWSDIKMCINLFNSTLEDVLGSQGSDFDFDD